MAQMLEPEQACPHLLDVLEMLPLDVVESNVWHVLSSDLAPSGKNDNGSPGSFKLACRQSRALADVLTTTISHDISRDTGPHTSNSAAGDADWQRAVQQRSAFLARLPRLHGLLLESWSSDADLTTALSQLGTATQGRLTQLTIRSDQLSVANMQAVLLACPALRELSLAIRDEPGEPTGPLFGPLHGAEHLTMIRSDVGYLMPDEETSNKSSNEYLSSLAGLSRLQHLHITVEPCDLHDLTHLTGLCGLRHFRAALSEVGVSRNACLDDLAAVFAAATQLTTLHLSNLSLTNDEQLYFGGASVSDTSLLGALRGLQSLDLGQWFDLDDQGWASVSQLSRLTHLGYGLMTASGQSRPGCLPLLRHLKVGWGSSEGETGRSAKPSDLLRVLLPLLPLPSLVQLQGFSGRTLCFPVSISRMGEDVEEQSAALLSACQHLAAVPQLRLGTHVCLFGEKRVKGLPLGKVAAGLQVLREKPTHLKVDRMDLTGVQWVTVQQALPSLRDLVFFRCQLSRGDLAALVQGFISLVLLTVSHCFDRELDKGVACAQVAEVCLRPLQVRVEPSLSPSVIAECQAVQERLYGRQFITWEQLCDDALRD